MPFDGKLGMHSLGTHTKFGGPTIVDDLRNCVLQDTISRKSSHSLLQRMWGHFTKSCDMYIPYSGGIHMWCM